MITVHHLEDSRSQRVLWLLEELGLEYEIKRYERDKETRLAPASLKKVHPLGKSPVIDVDGRTVAETGAIVEFLIDNFGDGALKPPAGGDAALKYTYWLHFAEGSAMPQLLLMLFFSQIKEAKMPFFAKPIAKSIADRVLNSYVNPNVRAQLSYIDAELKNNEWLAGDTLTGADIMMSFPMEAAMSRTSLKPYKRIVDYVKRIQARPAYQAALERGGPYSYGG